MKKLQKNRIIFLQKNIISIQKRLPIWASGSHLINIPKEIMWYCYGIQVQQFLYFYLFTHWLRNTWSGPQSDLFFHRMGSFPAFRQAFFQSSLTWGSSSLTPQPLPRIVVPWAGLSRIKWKANEEFSHSETAANSLWEKRLSKSLETRAATWVGREAQRTWLSRSSRRRDERPDRQAHPFF